MHLSSFRIEILWKANVKTRIIFLKLSLLIGYFINNTWGIQYKVSSAEH